MARGARSIASAAAAPALVDIADDVEDEDELEEVAVGAPGAAAASAASASAAGASAALAVASVPGNGNGAAAKKSSARTPTSAEKLLAGELPRAAERFRSSYGRLADLGDLHGEVVDRSPAKELNLVVQHLRDLSWRSALTPAQLEQIALLFQDVLAISQKLVDAVKTSELPALLANGGASAESFLAATALALEVCSLYCNLAGLYGAPSSLLMEELTTAVVQCVKHGVKQVAETVLAPREAEAEQAANEALKALHEVSMSCIATLAETMHGLHEFLCRHGLDDGLLHQIVHAAVGCFFFTEPHFPLCAAAEELLVTIFGRNESLRTSILQDIFVKVPRLPSGKQARLFHLPVSSESSDYHLTTWTHLLLRLIQSTSLPLREPLGGDVDVASVLVARASAQTTLSRLTSGLIQRLLLTRTRDEELRLVLEELVEEVINAAFKPLWPGALAWLRSMVHHFVGIIQPDKKKPAAEASVRECALKLLGKICASLYKHHAEVKQAYLRLPSWEKLASDKDGAEDEKSQERLLQHIALRFSLEVGGELPWTEAGRAVEAWDAQICLPKGDRNSAGLKRLTDDIVFKYLALAHLEDERYANARVPPGEGRDLAAEAFSACVFAAGHPVNAWSFVVCDWACDVAKRPVVAGNASNSKKKRRRVNIIQEDDGDAADDDGADAAAAAAATRDAERLALEDRILAAAWTSRVPLCGEGTSWRSGGGRRLLLPFTVYKLYRQLRSDELGPLRQAAVDCLVTQANSPQATLRKTAMRALSDIINHDNSVISLKTVEETIEMRLRDESSWVRQVSLDLLGRVLEGSLSTALESTEDGDKTWSAPPADSAAEEARNAGRGATASAMLLRFHETVRGRINDTSVLVRRQASKMLSAFILNHPDHPDVEGVATDLLRRSTDSDILRNLVIGTFELLWFAEEEPTARQAHQLARVVEASRSGGFGSGDILSELLDRFKKSLASKRHGKGFDYAVRRWTTVLLQEFVKAGSLAVPVKRVAKKTSDDALQQSNAHAQKTQMQRRALLSALEAFALAQPREMLVHLRPLTVHIALEESGSTTEEQWVASKVCQILTAVLPYAAERRGIMDHRQVQKDLQMLIKSQPSSGVREAMRCLCAVVKYVSGDLGQLVIHLNSAIPGLLSLCAEAEKNPRAVQRIQQMYMSRQAWVLASMQESLNIDTYIEKPDATGAAGAVQTAGRLLPKSALRFEPVGGSVASTVAHLLLRIHALGEVRLQAVIVTCTGFFLRGQRSYVREKRIGEVFAHALAATDVNLRLKALETLASLLGYFGQQADAETRGGFQGAAEAVTASAIESAQPLAVYGDRALEHLSASSLSTPVTSDELMENMRRMRAEALNVVRQLQTQGLINPMVVLPKVFGLCFQSDLPLAEVAGSMLKDMLELRPTVLINRMEEALRDGFQSLLVSTSLSKIRRVQLPLSPAQLTPVCELYVSRFRKQKAQREAFLRRALRELFRLQLDRFEELFASLLESANGIGKENKDDGPPSAKKARSDSGRSVPLRRIQIVDLDDSEHGNGETHADDFKGLSNTDRCRLLYAEFICSLISSLPFAFESEPLLVVFECNRHLSLHAGGLTSSYDANNGDMEDASEFVDCEDKKKANGASGAPVDSFGEAVSVLACIVLKGAMKHDYGLTSEACAQFNPKEVRQERLKFLGAALAARMGSGAGAGAGADAEDAAPCSAKLRFPSDKWRKLATPLASCAKDPARIAAHIKSVLDDDPFDSSVSRHAAAIDRLEGKVVKRSRGKALSDVAAAEEAPAQAAVARGGRAGRGAAGRGAASRGGGGRARGKRKAEPAAGEAEEDFVAAVEEALDDEDIE
eukprot:TRINITY_DN22454_c1_g2_i1.p1 TRINITY_DN22454_c1_g2~~TRINITY_DN22454_c1_g2_i1.p1  ORF type:complete len:1852 (-),score=397.26 TRINITY_DN22454_c1_g2_i1:75-5585(-)